MAKVKIKFRPSSSADSPGSIVYLVTHNKTVRQLSAGVRLHSYEWDEKHSVTITAPDGQRNTILREIDRIVKRDIKSLTGIICSLDHRGSDYTSDDVVSQFRTLRGEASWFPFMEDIIERLKQLRQIGTACNYRATLGSFRRFREGRDIAVGDIDAIMMEDYQTFLKSAGLAQNSISFYMRIMRAVYNRAVEQGLTADRNPFRTVFTGMEKTRKRAISINDIRRIVQLDLSTLPSLEFSRDIFLFLFYCRGMSFVDAAFLRKTDIRNGILTYRRHKTGQQLYIKMIDRIGNLVDRYSVTDSPFLLPIITTPGDNERRQYETALRQVNKALKTIGKMAEISLSLTTYVCRHSWATIAKTKNVPLSVISDALGHESTATTQIYLDSIDTSVIDQANEIVISGL